MRVVEKRYTKMKKPSFSGKKGGNNAVFFVYSMWVFLCLRPPMYVDEALVLSTSPFCLAFFFFFFEKMVKHEKLRLLASVPSLKKTSKFLLLLLFGSVHNVLSFVKWTGVV